MKLMYFNAKGVVETTRIVLAAAGQEYEDFRYNFTFGTPGDFSTIQRPEFDADKAAGKLTASFGKLPLLVVGDAQIAQSKAIERFVARHVGMMGDNEFEAAACEVIQEHIRDSKDAYQKAKKEGDDAVAKFFSETLPTFCTQLEATLGDNSFAVGTKLSLADVALWVYFNEFFDNKEGAAAAQDGCPKLMAALEKVATNDGVIAWLASRPDTPF